MSRREEKLEQLVINDLAAYNKLIEKSAEKLVIIDIHQEWCGVCEAIQPTLIRVTKTYENCSKRMELASVSLGKIDPKKIQASLGVDAKVDLNGCLPVFAVFRFKHCVSIFVGVDAPALLNAISLNIPQE